MKFIINYVKKSLIIFKNFTNEQKEQNIRLWNINLSFQSPKNENSQLGHKI